MRKNDIFQWLLRYPVNNMIYRDVRLFSEGNYIILYGLLMLLYEKIYIFIYFLEFFTAEWGNKSSIQLFVLFENQFGEEGQDRMVPLSNA